MTLPESHLDLIILAAHEAAITIRDEGVDATREAAQRVLQAAHGDAIAAISVLAALIPVDRPLDPWWQSWPHAKPIPAPPEDTTVDPVVVERLIGGDRSVKARPVERRAAVAALDRLPVSLISARIGVTTRSVARHRSVVRAGPR
jgi:DNA polymerase III delta prime subunit